MKILVTGGSGFIGSHIVDELSQDKNNKIFIFDIVRPDHPISENVRYVDGDICYKTSLDKYIPGCEEVYDCATRYSRISFSNRESYRYKHQGCF